LEEICEAKLSSNTEASTFKNDDSASLTKAIDSLFSTTKELITLRYFNNMKIDEIVNVTDMSRSTVKRQLQAAIDELNKIMKG
jgi:RNA polymerase sigma-70 factor (ECF subfamily)